MSQENVDLMNDVVDALNTGGVEAALAYVHPEIAWYGPPEWLEQEVYNGHQGLRELNESWRQSFDEYGLDLKRVIDLGGNRVVALLMQHGRIKAGGNPMELALAWTVEVLDGQLARVDVHFSWKAALEAAGLSE